MLKPPDPRPAPPRESRAYFLGTALILAAGGVSAVLYPWLVTVWLEKPAEWVGFAQMMSMLPMFLFVLHAGALADRVELRGFILALCALSLLPPAALGALVLFERLDYALLVAYAFAWSALGAFMMTARETALIQIATHEGRGLQQMILTSTAIQFGAQIAGNAAAGFASVIGPAPLIGLQSALILASLTAFLRLKPQHRKPAEGPASRSVGLASIREGLVAAASEPRVWPFLVQNFLGGILFMGVWMVGMPLMLRDVYGAGSGAFAIVSIAFMVGVTAGTLALSRRPPVRRQGRFVLISLVGSWLSLVGFALTPPAIWMAYGLMLWWDCAPASPSPPRARWCRPSRRRTCAAGSSRSISSRRWAGRRSERSCSAGSPPNWA